MDTSPWRQKVRRRRSRRRHLSLTSAKSTTSDKAICPESDASVKSIDAVLGKVCLHCLQPSKSSVHAPLLWSRQLDLSGTVLTQFLYLRWHHCHTSMCSHIPLSRRSSGVLTLMVSYPVFGTTLNIDFSGDAWFRRAGGHRN